MATVKRLRNTVLHRIRAWTAGPNTYVVGLDNPLGLLSRDHANRWSESMKETEKTPPPIDSSGKRYGQDETPEQEQLPVSA